MCKDDAERGGGDIVIHDTHTRTFVLVGPPHSRGRPGFNEDRRICPIKTSYKDLSGSALIRKTSNLDFAAAAQPLLIPALYRYTFLLLSLSRYRYRTSPSETRRTRGGRGFMELVSNAVEIRACRFRYVIGQNAIHEQRWADLCYIIINLLKITITATLDALLKVYY